MSAVGEVLPLFCSTMVGQSFLVADTLLSEDESRFAGDCDGDATMRIVGTSMSATGIGSCILLAPPSTAIANVPCQQAMQSQS